MRQGTDAVALLELQVLAKRAEVVLREAYGAVLAMGHPGPPPVVSVTVREAWRTTAEAVAIVGAAVRESEAGNVVQLKGRRRAKR